MALIGAVSIASNIATKLALRLLLLLPLLTLWPHAQILRAAVSLHMSAIGILRYQLATVSQTS